MKYLNVTTGVIIDVKSEITEGPWQALKPAISSEKDKIAPAQKKKKGIRNNE